MGFNIFVVFLAYISLFFVAEKCRKASLNVGSERGQKKELLPPGLTWRIGRSSHRGIFSE
jgi:hypothetical protein